MKIPFTKTLEEKIAAWSDQDCLFNFSHFLDRVGISTRFVQDEDGLVTHQILVMSCGDKYFASAPKAFLAPLIFVASTPEELKKAN